MSRLAFPPQFLAPRLYTQPCVQEPRRRRRIRCPSQIHFFHTTCRLFADNYYETLGISPSASQADVKKQFYQLSKRHHPDHNPNNREEASEKFVEVSAAYTVLGNPSKREKYDRDLARSQGPQSSPGSYSSSQAGGRRASGLSKRRGHFRGPPPSFYRSGGWGAQSSKRSENAGADGRSTYEDTEARRQQRAQEQYGANSSASSSRDGGPFVGPNDVPHFDRDQHYRTQTTVEEHIKKRRIRRRMSWDMDDVDDGYAGAIGRFLMVTGVVALGLGTPFMLFLRTPGG